MASHDERCASANMIETFPYPPIPIALLAPMLSSMVLLCLVVLSVLVLQDADNETRLVRAWHGARWRLSRVPSLLRAHGLEPAAYLRGTPVRQLKEQVTRCRRCKQGRICRLAGRGGWPPAQWRQFCRNASDIVTRRMP